MSLVTQNYFVIPQSHIFAGTAFSSLLIDASGEKVAFIIQIPKTGTVSKIGFRTGTVTTPQTLRVGLYTVDGSGDATTTAYGGMVAGTQTSPASTTNYLVTLGTNSSVTAGDIVAVVIEFDSTVGNLNIAYAATETNVFPYVELYTGTWAKTAATPVVSLEYDDGSYAVIYGCVPPGSSTNTTFNSGSTPDEYALYFKLKGPVNLNGVSLYGGASATGADFSLVLYDTDGTTSLASLSIDGDTRASTSATTISMYTFTSAITLSKDVFYYLSLKPTTANNCRLTRYTVANAGSMDSLPGGSLFYEATRTDAGGWSTTTTVRPGIYLHLSAIDDGTSSSGSGGAFTFIG